MILRFLRRVLPYKEIGWWEIGEEFTRFSLCKTRWFNLYLHRVKAQKEAPQCHDHPWTFIALLLWGGYWEWQQGVWTWHRPGSILYRPAKTLHNVMTPTISWSLVLTGPKVRVWGFRSCE